MLIINGVYLLLRYKSNYITLIRVTLNKNKTHQGRQLLLCWKLHCHSKVCILFEFIKKFKFSFGKDALI